MISLTVGGDLPPFLDSATVIHEGPECVVLYLELSEKWPVVGWDEEAFHFSPSGEFSGKDMTVRVNGLPFNPTNVFWDTFGFSVLITIFPHEMYRLGRVVYRREGI